LVKRIRNILAALIAAPDMDAVRGPPGWKIQAKRQPRRNVEHFSQRQLAHHIRHKEGEICNLNLEDYH
jgi:hypothetical protein